MTTEDIARFGQLYLQKGEWGGKRILPAEWVAAATARQVSNGSNPASDWDQGYGYQFWRCRHGVYRGDGAFGQYCIVMPEQDAVVAITSGVRDMQAVLNLVWEHLLPAMKAAAPLPADAPAQDRLAKKLASLSLPPQPGRPTSPTARRVSGRVFELPKNDDGIEAVAVDLGQETTLAVTASTAASTACPSAMGAWRRGGQLPDGPRALDGRRRLRRGRERGLDRRRHVHGQGLLPRDAVLRHARPAVRRGRARPRPGDERRLRPDEAADAGRPSAPGRRLGPPKS